MALGTVRRDWIRARWLDSHEYTTTLNLELKSDEQSDPNWFLSVFCSGFCFPLTRHFCGVFSTINFPFLETTASGDMLPLDTFKMRQRRFRESCGYEEVTQIRQGKLSSASYYGQVPV